MRSSSTVAVAIVALVAALAGTSHAAPFPSLARRQADLLSDDTMADPDALADDNSIPDDSAAWAAPADSMWADSSDTAPDDTTNNNLVGNSFLQVDDSVNVSNTDVEYPGDSELTGNTGTAVSGNNNDIMPIINAPVTVIINSNENDRHHHHQQRPMPQSPMPGLSGVQPGNTAVPPTANTAAPQAPNPIAPQGLNPAAPQGLNPAAPQGLNPATSPMGNPMVPQGLNPATSPMGNPMVPQGLNPAASQDINTSFPQSLAPVTPQSPIPAGSRELSVADPQMMNLGGMAPGQTDPFADRIQQLIAYALAVSQTHA